VPADLAEQIVSAARAQSALAQLPLELVTSDGASMGLPLAGSHGTAAWTAESGSYTPSDETITQVSLSAFKGTGGGTSGALRSRQQGSPTARPTRCGTPSQPSRSRPASPPS
jgi:hypothetical protein